MKCQNCGKGVHVFINSPGPQGIQSRYYCAACGHSSSLKRETKCPCGSTFSEFLETGFFGCASCYATFESRIVRLLARYRGKEVRTGFDYFPDRLASIRSVEIAERLSLPVRASAAETVWIPGCISEDINPGPILLSIRIRLARNVHGVPYLRFLGPGERDLLGRMLISSGTFLGKLFKGRGDGPEFYTGDEDHLRAQWLLPYGLNCEEDAVMDFIERTSQDIQIIDASHCWQHHPIFGFLTACPANSGTAVRISFRMNVRALRAKGLWGSWRRELKAAGMEIRGANGEGSYESEITEISNRHPYHHDLKKDFLRIYGIVRRLADREKNLRILM
jgi:hypothetical protein